MGRGNGESEEVEVVEVGGKKSFLSYWPVVTFVIVALAAVLAEHYNFKSDNALFHAAVSQRFDLDERELANIKAEMKMLKDAAAFSRENNEILKRLEAKK